MTSRETPEGLKQSYGFGWSANGTTFGHGGAYSTNMSIDTKLGLITIFMVQNAGWRSDEGKKIQPEFNKAATDAFGK